MNRHWIYIALINFLVAACLGATLRWIFVSELPWIDFKNILHAHSHLAMLGWIYIALYYLIWLNFIPASQQGNRNYNRLFWFTQLTVLGMTISFIVQGYGTVSITFTTLNILAHYLFFGLTRRDLAGSVSASGLLLRTALIWCLLSTLGVWMLGPVMMGAGRGTVLYFMSIQFYLHFQFNGWFTFAVLALFFRYLENNAIVINLRNFKLFYRFLVVATLLTYALSVTWSTPISGLFYLNSLGVILQLVALFFLLRIIFSIDKKLLNDFSNPIKILLLVALVSFIIKIIIQSLVVLPQIAVISYTIRQFVIGFIHLTLLGSISMYLIAFLFNNSSNTPVDKSVVLLFVSGFLMSETILFAQGLMFWLGLGFMPYYYELLLGASLLLPLSIYLIYRCMISSKWMKSHVVT